MPTFEQGFATTEQAAIAAEKAAKAVAAAAKQMHKAALEGNISGIRKASERLAATVDIARQEVSNARAAWPFTPEGEEAHLRNGYESELLDAAVMQGLKIHERDGNLVAHPSIVRIQPTDRSVKVDRKRIPSLRPSRLTAILRANQDKKPRISAERFAETLYRAYRLLTGKDAAGSTIALADIYQALTLLPGTGGEYGEMDFLRDLFFLDRSGVTQTRTGASFSLPASTGTRGTKALTFVAPDGQTVIYYGIRFTEGSR